MSPETSTNTSIGFVYSPSYVNGLTVTYDNWEIEKEDTVVLLGRDNRLIEDLVLRLEHGPNNCSAFNNPNVLEILILDTQLKKRLNLRCRNMPCR